jgi:hypothetical protein
MFAHTAADRAPFLKQFAMRRNRPGPRALALMERKILYFNRMDQFHPDGDRLKAFASERMRL